MVSVLLLLMLPDRGSLTFMPRRFGDFIEAIGCGCRCRFVKVISRQASVYKNDTKKGTYTYVTIICQSGALLTIVDMSSNSRATVDFNLL